MTEAQPYRRAWKGEHRRRSWRLSPAFQAIALAAMGLGLGGPRAQGQAEGQSCESLIAFASNRPDGPGLYVVEPAGGEPRLLVPVPGALQIRWTPDGQRIGFLSVTAEDEELFRPYGGLRFHAFLYTVRPDGTDLRRVGDVPMRMGFSWSPDGSRVAFASAYEGGGSNSAIYVVDSDGTHRARLTGLDRVHAFPAWSPDGTRIAFASREDEDTLLEVISPNGTGRAALIEIPGSRAWTLLKPIWSPSAGLLAFAEGRGTYIVSASGGDPQRIDRGNGEPRAWSPGRRRVLMSEASGASGRIYLLDLDANETRELADDAGVGGDSSPSPLWDRVAYTSIVDGQADVYVLPLDGGKGRSLTDDPANDYFPAWSPCLSTSP